MIVASSTYSLFAEGVGEQGGERERKMNLVLRRGKEQGTSDSYINYSGCVC